MKSVKIFVPMTFLLLLALTLGCPPAPNYDNLEYFEDYPYLTNETLGKFNYIRSITLTPPDDFALADWGPVLGLPGAMGGGSNFLRYMLAFTTYGVSMMAEHTPAYRKPYVESIDGMIQKMLDHDIWDYWLSAEWGGDDPIHPYNIMYTGHLQLMMAFHERYAGDQKYLSDVELTTADGIQTWTTNLYDLSVDIHNLTLTNQNSLGENYYSVPCETPWVFTPCNTIPQLAFSIIPADLGLDAAAVQEPFLTWHRENMLDPVTKYFYVKYSPFEEIPNVDTAIMGGYSSWSWAFIYGFDPDWTEENYPAFMSNALESFGPETAVVRFGAPNEPSDIYLFDLFGTGYAMVLARTMGDEAAYGQLMNGFNYWAGEPFWAGSHFGYFNIVNWPIFKVLPTGFTLWAEATSSEVNFLTVVESPRDAAFYEQPFLADVTDPLTFVNQAIWDAPVLYIAINGGPATTASTDLVVQNLKVDSAYHVLLDGEIYTDWTLSEGEMTITTPPLSGLMTQKFQIVEEAPAL